jgi:hypothetical protein
VLGELNFDGSTGQLYLKVKLGSRCTELGVVTKLSYDWRRNGEIKLSLAVET